MREIAHPNDDFDVHFSLLFAIDWPCCAVCMCWWCYSLLLFFLFVVSHLSFRFWLHFFFAWFCYRCTMKTFLVGHNQSLEHVMCDRNGSASARYQRPSRVKWYFRFHSRVLFFFCLFSVGLISNHGVAIYFHFTRCFIIRWIRIRWMKVKGIYTRINIYIEHRLQSPNKYDYIFCAADSLSIIDNHLSPNHLSISNDSFA